MEINPTERTIKVKIVYYGPPLGGKTTNLQQLHKHADASRRGELVSINSAQDRTILFDLVVFKTAGFRGFEFKIELIAVPGQPIYAAMRRIALKEVDGLVFVANSAVDRWEDNIQSHKEVMRNLTVSSHQADPRTIPLVLQYNKRDLPNVMPVESLDRALNPRRLQPVLAVAPQGEGVLETFSAILLETTQDLVARHRGIAMAPGLSVPDWVAESVQRTFGRTSFATRRNTGPMAGQEMPATPSGPEPGHRKVSIAIPEETAAAPASGPPRKADETLVDSYAEASAQLGEVVAGLREERDLAAGRLREVAGALEIADELRTGTSVIASLTRALGLLGEAAGSHHASFLLPAHATSFRAVLRPPLAAEPLLTGPPGMAVLETFRDADRPAVARASERPDVQAVLEAFEPRFAAVTVVPIRGVDTLLGFVVLYYPPDAALPSAETLGHLDVLARILRTSLDLAVARGAF